MKLVFCIPGKTFSNNFVLSWTDTLTKLLGDGHQVRLAMGYDSNVYLARQRCLGANILKGINQKPFNLDNITDENLKQQLDYDYLIWIDSDVVWSYNQLIKLLGHNKDICSGLCLMESGTHFATVFEWDNKYFKKHGMYEFLNVDDLEEIQKENKLKKVAYTGFAFMVIKKGVFESMKYPWFKPKTFSLGSDIEDICSEDVSFCIRAQEHGYDVFVDPSIVVGHEKSLIVGLNQLINSVDLVGDI